MTLLLCPECWCWNLTGWRVFNRICIFTAPFGRRGDKRESNVGTDWPRVCAMPKPCVNLWVNLCLIISQCWVLSGCRMCLYRLQKKTCLCSNVPSVRCETQRLSLWLRPLDMATTALSLLSVKHSSSALRLKPMTHDSLQYVKPLLVEKTPGSIINKL